MRRVTRWLGIWLGALILGAFLDQFVPIKTQLLALFALLAAMGLLVAYGTIARNRWGINHSAVSCPRCHSPLPTQRQPRSRRQRLWGGWTCAACGAKSISGDAKYIPGHFWLTAERIVEVSGVLQLSARRLTLTG